MKMNRYFIVLFVGMFIALMVSCKGKPAAKADEELIRERLSQIAGQMERDVERVLEVNKMAAEAAAELFQKPWKDSKIDRKIYFRDRHGILSDHKRTRKTNVYVDRPTPENAYIRGFIAATEKMEPAWEKAYAKVPNLGWQYLTETKYDSMRIFPWVETTRSYGPDIDWKKYGFYECAMTKNNPARKQCWGNIGHDMLGLGVISSISTPIYRGNEFVAIMSTDFLITRTFRKYMQEVLPGKNSYIVLINSDSLVLFREEKDGGERGWDEMYECNALSDCAKKNGTVDKLLKRIAKNDVGNVLLDVGFKKKAYFQKLSKTDWVLLLVAEVKS